MSEQSTTSSISIKPDAPTSARKSFFPWRKVLIAVALVVFFTSTLAATGLAMFTGYVLFANEHPPAKADAIVVVTGGAGRLDRAVALLQDGMGKKLLISGVHPRYSNRTLLNRFDLTSSQINCCIDLDSQALNTVANATQTAVWAQQNGFKSLIIVTSAYHMPRTMLEMRRAAPDIQLQSNLVTPSNQHSVLSRLFNWNNMHLLTKEYGKLLASILHGTSERLNPQKNRGFADAADTVKAPLNTGQASRIGQ
ncbi:YdcF family protein [Cohaesibacter celericrescens]|uniref:DUF218 domain-containing protein n=1 Tax=Cohaesibacter celericrescens TaxID=2067669 RepID=A0A2N5XU79_9HYPH|nr:YdcF family protein [Cohaesibacter celericrescens]PLW78054.1 hypothetical protein C0081_06265 [Cohaesibacter celericrescens]